MKSSGENTGMMWLIRIAVPLAMIASVGYIVKIMMNKDNFEHHGGTDEERIRRAGIRGTFASLLGSVILNAIGALFAWLEVPESMIIMNYGFMLGPAIGYMLDIGYGTDTGKGHQRTPRP